jgi:lysozyme
MLAQTFLSTALALAPMPLPPESWETPMPAAKRPYKMSVKGRTWLRDAEGCELKAYEDSGGVWTIGVGHTGLVNGKPIGAGMAITLAQCDSLLIEDLQEAEAAVQLAAKERLSYQSALAPTQPQIDALVSFVFNAGVAGFAQSEVRRDFVAGRDVEVAHDLFMWTRAGSNPVLLFPRRAREAFLYARGIYLGNAGKPI